MNENGSPRKEVIGIMESGEICTLAEFTGTGWSLMNSHWSLQSSKNSSKDNHIFELVSNKMVGNHTVDFICIVIHETHVQTQKLCTLKFIPKTVCGVNSRIILCWL